MTPCDDAGIVHLEGASHRGNAGWSGVINERHRPRMRAIQYSRDGCDRIEKPRRTGYPARGMTASGEALVSPLVQHRLEIRPRALRLGARGVGGIDEAEIAVDQPLARMIFDVDAGMNQRIRIQRALVAQRIEPA